MTYAQAAPHYDKFDDINFPLGREAQRFSFNMPAHDVWLYAVTEANKYYVDYHGHGETSWEMTWSEYTYDITWDLKPNVYLKEWYTFQEWNESENGGGTGHANEAKVFNWTTEESGHIHIYAQWIANYYNIHYNLNKGEGTSDPQYGLKHPTTWEYDKDVEINHPSRTWYSFSGWDITDMEWTHVIGWVTGTDASATEVLAEIFKNLRPDTGTVNFTAKWSADEVLYTINHYLQELNGSYPSNPSEVNTGTYTADQFMTWDTNEYTWFDTPAETRQIIDANGTTVFTYNYPRQSHILTLIAGKWVDTVTVADTPYSSGGTNSGTDAYTIKYGDAVNLSYVELDWYENFEWTGYTGQNSFSMPATGITMEIKATPITYTITQDCQWWTGCVETQEYNVESAPILLPTPTGTHTDFVWWMWTDIEGTVPTYTIPTGSTWNKVYTAQWKCHTWYHASSEGSGNCIPNENTEYTIEYYRESLTWNMVLHETGSNNGETDSQTTVVPKDYVWFTPREIVQQNINWDGTTVVRVEYDRDSYGQTIIDGTGITTTAVWAYDSNADGSGQHQYWDTVTLSQTTKSGYTFDHWEVKDASWNDVTLNGNTFTMPASDVTIKSYSTTNEYDLHIIKNWGTGGSDDRTYTVEDTVTLIKPSRDNSTFVWWSWTDITGDPEPTVSFSWRAKNSTYEAVWDCVTWYTESDDGQKCEANTYTVTINYDDGDHSDETTGFVYDQTWHIDNPEKSWYDFAWWTVSWADSTATVDWDPLNGTPTSGTEFKNLTTTSGGTVTLTATWTPRSDTEYKVYYYTAELSGGYKLADTKTWAYTSDQDKPVSELVYDMSWYKTPTQWYTGWGVDGPSGTPDTAITIDRHGTTEIYLFYDRDKFTVYLSGDQNVLSLSGAAEYTFWDTVNVSATVKSWYHFKEWQKRWSGFALLWSGS